MAEPGGVLLTGFAPFGGLAVNPSQLLVERLADLPGVSTATLPVSYAAAPAQLIELIETRQPRALLCFGLALRSDYLLIERVAWNRDESDAADNDGEIRDDQPIVEDGPTAYGCSLPIPEMMRVLALAGLPVSFSDHAGGFVCNHLYYAIRHYIDSRELYLPMAFIHVPPLPEQVETQKGRRGLPFDQLESGGRALADWLRRGLTAIDV